MNGFMLIGCLLLDDLSELVAIGQGKTKGWYLEVSGHYRLTVVGRRIFCGRDSINLHIY